MPKIRVNEMDWKVALVILAVFGASATVAIWVIVQVARAALWAAERWL